MSIELLANGGLDYQTCQYGHSKLSFRGPKRHLDGDYVAFLGGTETYGRFVMRPFADLVEDRTGTRCINFGVTNAGVDTFLNDPFFPFAAAKAKLTVLQVVGANNMSNRFFSVHPRRNDRFLRASKTLRGLYPEVDFTEIHFTRHLLSILQQVAPERYGLVIEEIQQAWVARMELLIQRLGGEVALLWFADHRPGKMADQGDVACNPYGVERWMLERLEGCSVGLIEATVSVGATDAGVEGMVFSPVELPMAQSAMNAACHDEAGVEVSRALGQLL